MMIEGPVAGAWTSSAASLATAGGKPLPPPARSSRVPGPKALRLTEDVEWHFPHARQTPDDLGVHEIENCSCRHRQGRRFIYAENQYLPRAR